MEICMVIWVSGSVFRLISFNFFKLVLAIQMEPYWGSYGPINACDKNTVISRL